jgi:hypothetical protein
MSSVFSITLRILCSQTLPGLSGAWVAGNAAEMRWSEGHIWIATVPLPASGIVEYKYVLLNGAGQPISWQRGNNSVLALKGDDNSVTVRPSSPPNAGFIGVPDMPRHTQEHRKHTPSMGAQEQGGSHREEPRTTKTSSMAGTCSTSSLGGSRLLGRWPSKGLQSCWVGLEWVAMRIGLASKGNSD